MNALDKSAAQAARECDGLPEPASHTQGRCSCCLEPVDDTRERCDVCSEATGSHDGTGWAIRYCPMHNAAPALLEACREALTAARLDEWDGAGSIRHDAFQALVAAIAQAVGE